MKRCWIHIGMPKTGSTSVQAYLAKHRIQPGWEYIALGPTANMNREMHAMFGTAPHKWYWFAKRGESQRKIARRGRRLRKRFAEAITQSTAENILVSAEALSVIKKPGIRALRDFIAPLCDEVRVIGYVRPPIGFMTSFLQQRIKNGNTKFDVTVTLPSYRERFEKFDKVFGRKNVRLYKFEPASFPNKCFVTEFCQRVGMPAPGEVKRANESLSREACGILFAYRTCGPGYGVGKNVVKINNLLIAPMYAMSGAKFRLSRDITAPGLDEDDIAWMRKRLKDPLDENLKDDGTEISSEQDLLRVTRAACLEYAEKFHDFHGIRISSERIPDGDPVDPKEVAEFIEHCRGLIRKKLRTRLKREATGPKSIRSKVGSVFKRVRETLTLGGKSNE